MKQPSDISAAITIIDIVVVAIEGKGNFRGTVLSHLNMYIWSL